MIRAGLILAAILFLVLAAYADGIWSGGGVIGQDGIANKNAIGMNGIAGINASGSSGGGGCSNGSTDLSTTCGVLTFAAIGIL
jgi:hypothetical protein